jgi:hypothetical protein
VIIIIRLFTPPLGDIQTLFPGIENFHSTIPTNFRTDLIVTFSIILTIRIDLIIPMPCHGSSDRHTLMADVLVTGATTMSWWLGSMAASWWLGDDDCRFVSTR